MAQNNAAARAYSSKLSVISASSTSSSSTIKPDNHQQQNSRETSAAPRPPRAQPPPTVPTRSSAKTTSTTQGSAPGSHTPAALIAAGFRQAQRSAMASPRTLQGENIPPLLDEKSAIEGLHRLLQATLSTIKEIEPVMRQAAEGDLHVAAPALGLFWASLRVPTKPPIIALPTADWDNNLANSFPTAHQARHVRGPLLTAETCPLSLRPLFQLWCNIIPRVQALSPRLQSEVARIICELEPLEFPLVPQVNRLAADLRNAAIELSARRGFLDALEEDLRIVFAGGTARRDSGSHSEAGYAFDDAESGGSRAFTDTDEHDEDSVQTSLNSSPSSKPLVRLPVEVGLPLDIDIDEVVRRASLDEHGYHHAQEYALEEDRQPPSEPGHHHQFGKHSHSMPNSNPVPQDELPLRKLPLPMQPRDDHADFAQLTHFEPASSDRYNHNLQIPQLSVPPELPPISYSAPASPSAGSLMLSFWNTNMGHDINDGHAPTYSSPPSFGQAVPLFNAGLEMVPPLRRTTGDSSNDPNQLFGTSLVPLTHTTSKRARGPRPLPPVPHEGQRRSSITPSPSATPPTESTFVAPPPVEHAPHAPQVSQRRPLPTFLGPSVPALSSIRGGILGPELSKSASYATSSFSSTAQPPGGTRYASTGNWGWKPPSLAGSTPQTWGAEPHSSSQNTSTLKLVLASEVRSKMEYPMVPGQRPRQRSLTSIVDRSKGAVSVASTTESVGGIYGSVETTDPLPSHTRPQTADQIRREPQTSSRRPPPEDLPTPLHHFRSEKMPSRESIGFALAYQCNPLAASSYTGASSSGSAFAPPSPPRATTSPPAQDQKEKVAPPSRPGSPADSAVLPDNVLHDTEMVAIRELFYGAVADALSTPTLRKVLVKDPSRAYFSAVSLAILTVATNTEMPSENTLQLPGSMIQVHLDRLPPAYRARMAELGAIGREARKMGEEDDDRAIAYVARGKPLCEPRMGRVRKLLERGVGYVDAKGRVRGGTSAGGEGTGRSRLFANRINALSLEIVELPGFHQRQDVFRILQGSR